MSAEGWSPSPGHIIHAQVQYSDSEGSKSRFPVVVSSQAFNEQYPEVIVAFTTSSKNIRHPRAYDVEVSQKRADFTETGLTHSTTVRCGRLWTLDKRRIADVIGSVPADILTEIQRLVAQCFGE